MGAYVCIYGHICAHMRHMCAHIGECVLESCAVQLAACDCKFPESAHLSASHSVPTVSDWQNCFFSAFGTSKIAERVPSRGVGAKCASKFNFGHQSRICQMINCDFAARTGQYYTPGFHDGGCHHSH